MKRTKLKTCNLFGVEIQAKTMEEAKKLASERILSAAVADFTPVVIRWRGTVAVVFRSFEGWEYTLNREEDEGVVKTNPCRIYHGSKDDAVRGAANHLAQNGYIPGEKPIAPHIITGAGPRDDFERWARWQNAYLEAKNADPSGNCDTWRAAANMVA